MKEIEIFASEYTVKNGYQNYPTFSCVDDIKNKWAIRYMGDRLTVDGEWIYEPMPSSRTNKFYKKTQFDFEKGMEVYKRIVSQIQQRFEKRKVKALSPERKQTEVKE